MLHNIPDDLKSFKQFVVWKAEYRDGKPTKVPYNAHTGQRASVDDPATWCDFDTACRVAQTGEVAGVGFMLSVNDPFGFIDLDDPWKTDAAGNAVHANPQAEFERQQNIAATFDSYTERSPSGKGAHVIVRTPGVANGRRRGGVEVYTSHRFMTMTGDVIRPVPIADRTELFGILWAELGGASANTFDGAAVYQAATETDDAIFNRATNAADGGKFKRLWNGDASDLTGDTSGSAIDQALVNILAFWTKDPAQIERLWLASPQGQRDKTQHRVDYRRRTIERAFDRTVATMDFSHLFKAPSPDELPVVMASALHGKPVQQRLWHVAEIIPARTVTLFGGDGGTGKSLVALQLAVGTVLGRAWFGVAIQQPGGALFLTAEDDLDEVHRRLADIANAEHVPLSAFDRLAISSLAGLDALMAAPGPGGRVLVPTGVYAAVRAHVEAHRPTLIVLDTLADLFGGDEVNRAQVRQFVAMLRAIAIDFGTTVVLLAHPSVNGMSNGSGLSGSTVWNNSVRSRLYMKRDDQSDLRTIEVMKANYGAVGQQISVKWERGAFVIVGTVGTAAAKRKANDQSADELFLQILAAFDASGKTVARAPQSIDYAPKLFAKHPDAQGFTKQQFAVAMDRLFSTGRIGEQAVGFASKSKRVIVAAATSNSTSNMPSNSTSGEFPTSSNSAENRCSNLFEHRAAESPIPARGESAPAWGGTHRP
ncbi:AAA family ATPase [Sphingobium sp. sgz301303]|uniref:phage NrS-1 polymerase family protein n=1 Tax=Sphingobium sp. sgz301303 TaxID=3342380 RepID=UPI0035A74D83